jgi:NADH-quinone oxidoreductase subunit J
VTGEAVLFWAVAIPSVLGALGLVLARKAVHGALCVAVIMLGLGILYVALDAPFLGIVQVVVYTGAILMVFLFVIMLVGIDASDSLVETIRGQRFAALLGGAAIGVILVTVIAQASFPEPEGLAAAQPDGNVEAIADAIFNRYVWAFEVASALLITAALGAMVLAHRERIERRPTQRELAQARFRPPDGDFAHAVGPPNPGIYARHNAVDTPGLLPDGSPSEESVQRVLHEREDERTQERIRHEVVVAPSRLEETEEELAKGGEAE